MALGLLVVNDIGVASSVSKRKVWRRRPNRPWGSIARGMRTMLRVRRSPIIVSPTVMMPVVGSVLLYTMIERVQFSNNHLWDTVLMYYVLCQLKISHLGCSMASCHILLPRCNAMADLTIDCRDCNREALPGAGCTLMRINRLTAIGARGANFSTSFFGNW